MKKHASSSTTRKPYNQALENTAQGLLERTPNTIVLNLTKHKIAPDRDQPFTWIDVNKSGKAKSRYAKSLTGSIKQLDWLTQVRREPGQKVLVLVNADKLTHRPHIGKLCDKLLQSFPNVEMLVERRAQRNESAQNITGLHNGLELLNIQGVPVKPAASNWFKRMRQQLMAQQQYQVCHFQLSDL